MMLQTFKREKKGGKREKGKEREKKEKRRVTREALLKIQFTLFIHSVGHHLSESWLSVKNLLPFKCPTFRWWEDKGHSKQSKSGMLLKGYKTVSLFTSGSFIKIVHIVFRETGKWLINVRGFGFRFFSFIRYSHQIKINKRHLNLYPWKERIKQPKIKLTNHAAEVKTGEKKKPRDRNRL